MRAGTLPAKLTSFVGRRDELNELRELVLRRRLVTLIGPGGGGKTRLAIETARVVRRRFSGGVWFVDLAPLRDEAQIAPATLRALELQPDDGRPAEETLAAWMGTRRALLILDNCEHLTDGCAALVHTLLQQDSGSHVLATSREPLRVSGEQRYVLPPLAVSAVSVVSSATAEGELPDAVRLFADRATLVTPHFEVTAANVPGVSRICRRLDGLPLAIELAAAHLATHSLAEIEAGLNDRFSLLTGGARPAEARHQTLEAALEWSYRLLTAPEQRMLRWLSVFPGSYSARAAAEVAGPEGEREALRVLSGLVEKSLVARDEGDAVGESRYRLLESVRQFAAQRLASTDELPVARERHLTRMLAVASLSEQERRGPRELEWLDRLETEREDLRAALAWCRERSPTDDSCLRLVTDAAWFWFFRGPRAEALGWLQEALTATRGDAAVSLRARALAWTARFENEGGDPAAAARAEEAVALCRIVGEPWALADALVTLVFAGGGNALAQPGDGRETMSGGVGIHDEALALARPSGDSWLVARVLLSPALMHRPASEVDPLLDEALRSAQAAGDTHLLAVALRFRGMVALRAGDFARARAAHASELEIMQRRRDPVGVGAAYHQSAVAAYRSGDYEAAEQLLEDCLAHCRATLTSKPDVGVIHLLLGLLRLERRDTDGAERRFREALSHHRRQQSAPNVARALVGLACAAAARGDDAYAATLLGAAAGTLTPLRPRPYGQLYGLADRYEAHLTGLRARLDEHEPALRQAWQAGTALSLDEAAALATARADEAIGAGAPPLRAGRAGARRAAPDVLSPREAQVAALVARGLTNREIATALTVTEHTAMRHVEHILGKLGLRSRTQIAAWVVGVRANAPGG